MKEKLETVRNASAVRNRRRVITCTQALRLAKDRGVKPSEIGALCDEAGIKIRRCRLGCFK